MPNRARTPCGAWQMVELGSFRRKAVVEHAGARQALAGAPKGLVLRSTSASSSGNR